MNRENWRTMKQIANDPLPIKDDIYLSDVKQLQSFLENGTPLDSTSDAEISYMRAIVLRIHEKEDAYRKEER